MILKQKQKEKIKNLFLTFRIENYTIYIHVIQ